MPYVPQRPRPLANALLRARLTDWFAPIPRAAKDLWGPSGRFTNPSFFSRRESWAGGVRLAIWTQ